ncbi:MAG: RNA polymerase factor sigma-54, partial [Lachnospiraceae bacterium]|nr:RNA polymerase factor sigma-54 [Lachnospiraceae bacterium]
LSQKDLPEEIAYAVSLLIASLDEAGYLRDPLPELSEDLCVPLSLLLEACNILRTMEPAGVGAADLTDCLLLQLDRLENTEPAAAIVAQCLPLLARSGYRQIAKQLKCSETEVRSACDLIRQLNPKPGAVFHQPSQTVYVRPDIYVRMNGDVPEVSSAYEDRERFRISRYYTGLLKETNDEQAKAYLAEKLRQAQVLQWSIAQRQSTLLRCAQIIAEHQADFFRYGEGHLHPLRMREVADALQLHNSTISRAVRGKYLQCCEGLFPLSHFFSQEAGGGNSLSSSETKALLKQLIENEDSEKPLSDQLLTEKLSDLGCPVSRRTVAKYRSELGIPPAYRRGGS